MLEEVQGKANKACKFEDSSAIQIHGDHFARLFAEKCIRLAAAAL